MGGFGGLGTGHFAGRCEDPRGRLADRLFLSYMVRHNQGAVLMVGQLLTGGGGQETEVFQLAQHIESDQLVEISRINRMLADGSF